jgi:protein TonB
MLAIIAAHVAVIAVVMSAKMELPPRISDKPIVVDTIPDPAPPPSSDANPVPHAPRDSSLVQPRPEVPTLPMSGPIADASPQLPDFDRLIGSNTLPQPHVDPLPSPAPVRIGAQLATPSSELRPPYPRSKLVSEEQAVLRLKLTIDERGRVVAVEPIGPADVAFLEAARRHLLAHWRYRPATEDGRPVRSSAVITLRFELDG